MAKASSSIDLRPAKDASKTASNYITFEENKGLMIADQTGGIQSISDADQRNVLIDSDSVDIRDGQDVLASFGETAIIGAESTDKMILSSSGYQLVSADGSEWFGVSKSNSPTSEKYTVSEKIASANITSFTLSRAPVAGTSISVKTACFIHNGSKGTTVTATNTFTAGTANTITNTKTTTLAGRSVTGKWTVAYNPNSGNGIITVTHVSPTTGNSKTSLMSPLTYTSQNSSVDLGIMYFGSRRGTTQGNGSILLGRGLLSGASYQTVVGKYNSSSSALFVVGDGTESAPSNSLTISSDGEVWHKGDGYTVASGSNPVAIQIDEGTYVKSQAIIYGKLCQLSVTCRNSSATASGQNVFACIVAEKFRPKIYSTGGSYYGSYAIGGAIDTTGKLFVRNADSRSLPQIPTSNSITLTLTYMLA